MNDLEITDEDRDKCRYPRGMAKRSFVINGTKIKDVWLGIAKAPGNAVVSVIGYSGWEYDEEDDNVSRPTGFMLEVTWEVPETNYEWETRILHEKRKLEDEEARERHHYELLRLKYKDDVEINIKQLGQIGKHMLENAPLMQGWLKKAKEMGIKIIGVDDV